MPTTNNYSTTAKRARQMDLTAFAFRHAKLGIKSSAARLPIYITKYITGKRVGRGFPANLVQGRREKSLLGPRFSFGETSSEEAVDTEPDE